MEGSKIISVNSLPLARKGHKITCSAVIQEGCKTITADKTTGQYGPINADMTVLEQSVVSSLEVLTAPWGAKQLNRAANERISQGSAIRWIPERVNIWITELISTIRIFYR